MKPTRLHTLLFFVLLLVVAWYYDYHGVLTKRPQGFHAWRQTDCLALTKNYYDNGLQFFKPGISQYLYNDFTTAATVGECTWLYYTVAVLWKIFGEKEWIYRLLNVLIFFAGLYALMRTIHLFTKSIFLSTTITLLFFTSPVLAYYANNFLTDAPALGLVLIGTWYWVKYLDEKGRKYLRYGAAFFALAGLIKITALMLFCLFAGLFVLECIGVKLRDGKRIFTEKKWMAAAFASVIAINALWLWWAEQYNTAHNGWFTPNGIWPIWQLTDENVRFVTQEFFTYLVFTVYHRYTLYFLVALFAMLLIFCRKMVRVEQLVLAFATTGVVAYFLLFYKAFNNHDYYLVQPIILLLIVLVLSAILLVRNFPVVARSVVFRIALLLFLSYNIYYCHCYMLLRYDPPKEAQAWIDEKDVNAGLQRWFRYDWQRRMEALETIEPFLDSIGIGAATKVVTMPDQSYNISLYLMDRHGWNGHELHTAEAMQKRITNGAEFFIVNDTSYASEEPFIRPYMQHQFASYKNVMIYDLRPFGKVQ